MATCAFCSVIDGSSDAFVVARDRDVIAFLDRSPVFKGHTLVVPTAHMETIHDLPAEALGPLFARVQSISAAMADAVGAHGTFVAVNNVVSQSVPHLHVHVVPRRRKDGLRGFFWPRERYENDAEASAYAAAITAQLAW